MTTQCSFWPSFRVLINGLPSFAIAHCSAGVTATLDPESAKSAAFQEHVSKFKGEGTEPRSEAEILKESEEFFERLKRIAFAGKAGTGEVPAPACTQQSAVKSIYGSGEATTYQHTFEQTGE